MYDNSRVPSYTNVSSRPCRIQYSRWSLNTPTTGATIGHVSPQSTAMLSSSFYFPQSQHAKRNLTPNYVNIHPSPPPPPPPPPTSLSSSHLSNYQRPKSTIFHNFSSANQSTFYANDLRQRYESKAIVGIVKPMVHQRTYTQLNNNNNNNNNENKIPELMISSYHHNSTRSLYPAPPSPPPPPPSSATSSVIYRSRPTPSYNNINAQPPMAPRRHSSISNSKCLLSHRSSRTTSTSSSSIAAVNELSTAISSHENEQQQNDNRIIIDVKRLEMFYGSVGTVVKSTHSVARLYTTTTTTARQLASFEDWSSQQYGVPVWIYNTGANLKRTRQIRLILAQHESCFAVWSSLVSDQAEVRIPKENYITCWLPESTLLIVLKFEYDDACQLFFRHYYEILEYERRKDLANPPLLSAENSIQQQQTNISTNNKEIPRRYSRLRTISNKQDKEQQQQQQQQFELRRCRSLSKIRTVKKSDISGPINFEHVNHISSGCNRERPLLGTATLRSLHASMSYLPSNSTLNDKCFKQSKKHVSTLFEPRTTAV